MFGKHVIADFINRSAENETDRRRFMAQAGAAGLGVVGAAALPGLAGTASAAPSAYTGPDAAISDGAILNFALNLEYLEGEFYHRAVYGVGLPGNLVNGGKGTFGAVSGGKRVPFKSKAIRQYATEIAGDETNHVAFLRGALGSAKVTRPAIDLNKSFTAAAQAAGVIKAGQTFDPFASDLNFLIGAFLFEDVGVTAYKGASPLISNKTYLEAAAGILAVEAYHAGIIRTLLYQQGTDIQKAINKVSDARDSLDGRTDDDKGIVNGGSSTLVPTDGHSIAFSRLPNQVLNIVYLTPRKGAKSGGFFPHGVNNPGAPSIFTQT